MQYPELPPLPSSLEIPEFGSSSSDLGLIDGQVKKPAVPKTAFQRFAAKFALMRNNKSTAIKPVPQELLDQIFGRSVKGSKNQKNKIKQAVFDFITVVNKNPEVRANAEQLQNVIDEIIIVDDKDILKEVAKHDYFFNYQQRRQRRQRKPKPESAIVADAAAVVVVQSDSDDDNSDDDSHERLQQQLQMLRNEKRRATYKRKHLKRKAEQQRERHDGDDVVLADSRRSAESARVGRLLATNAALPSFLQGLLVDSKNMPAAMPTETWVEADANVEQQDQGIKRFKRIKEQIQADAALARNINEMIDDDDSNETYSSSSRFGSSHIPVTSSSSSSSSSSSRSSGPAQNSHLPVTSRVRSRPDFYVPPPQTFALSVTVSSSSAEQDSKRSSATMPSTNLLLKAAADSSTGSGEGVCVICLTGKRTIVLLPCKHLVFCNDCLPSLRRHRKLDQCPVCKAMVSSTLCVFSP